MIRKPESLVPAIKVDRTAPADEQLYDNALANGATNVSATAATPPNNP